MKKRKLAAGIAAAALVAVLSVSAVYAGNQGKSVSPQSAETDFP